MRSGLRLNVGCGSSPAAGYHNLDNSPSLRIQRNPILRSIARAGEAVLGRPLYTRFPDGVRQWDIRRGLPHPTSSVAVVYSSHMVEHLPRCVVDTFLREAHRVLVPGGVLRLALPDLERNARIYLESLDLLRRRGSGAIPCDAFMRSSYLGLEEYPDRFNPKGLYANWMARNRHAWMWDAPSLTALLQETGFRQAAERGFRESGIAEVALLDLESRRDESFYVEAVK